MRRRTLVCWGSAHLTAALLLGVVIAFGGGEQPGFDRWWNGMVAAHLDDWMLAAALMLDHVGGGWVAVVAVPLLVIISLVLGRRPRGALFAAAAFLASAGAVQLLKNVYGRARPDDMVVASDLGSFPSGHTANAATLAIVVFMLFPRTWVALTGTAWVTAMALSRTLLSVHWATDTLGGALVGAGVALLLAASMLPWARTPSRRRRQAERGLTPEARS
ncbi:phosphatase PAP2 family protein [Promicromonospora sukumoe]|uniref:phosphatase PAP2 family protein n=1 Tax=Promicromonospora sukumoe TaxID=88382 RepID=UPI00365A1006